MAGIVSITGGHGTHSSVTVYGNGTVVGGNGDDTVTITGKGYITIGDGKDVLTLGKGGQVSQTGAHGHDSIYTGATGSDTIFAQGTAIVSGPQGSFYEYGYATVSGGQLDIDYKDGVVTKTAVSGNQTLLGGLVPTELVGGSGNSFLNGGFGGPDTFIGGTGHTTMTGGDGSNLFEFLKQGSGGTTVITNFTYGQDQLYLEGKSLSYLQQNGDVSVSGGNTTITLDGGKTSIELQGVTSLRPWDVTTHK